VFYKVSSRDLPKVTVLINNRMLFCEVPGSIAEQQKGLMGREILFEHQGMLFHTHSRYQPLFTMKDVKFDLDAIFVGNDNTIKDIVPMRKMDRSIGYTTPVRVPIKYVIEVNKGYASRYGIKRGDRVKF